LARATLFKLLQELETEGRIKREIEPLQKVGKGRRSHILIRLSGRELSPVERALRHITSITGADPAPVRELFTKDVVKAILEIDSICTEQEVDERGYLRTRWAKTETGEFNEIALVTALARYDFESLALFEWDYYEPDYPAHRFFMDMSEKLSRPPDEIIGAFYAEKKKDPNVFPALDVVRRQGVKKRLDALLQWFLPQVYYGEEDRYVPMPHFVSAYYEYESTRYKNRACKVWTPVLEEWKKRKGGEKA
jgi:hypothetical protein